ncbi:MAG: protein-L-isoaspartate(D-aspartate) O-methyltransferase [Pseudomonadota bacterium]
MNTVLQNQDINKRIRLVMHLRKMGITDSGVLGAMEKVPRDFFVPDSVLDQAWDDTALPIGRGQTISQPLVVATMTQALQLSDRDKVLEIGTGCGYQTAILARIARRVYSIERHAPLLRPAEQRLKELSIHNVTTLLGDGMLGWPKMHGIDQAPFDKIIVTAEAQGKPPEKLVDQLRVGGMMVIPVAEDGEQHLKLIVKESVETCSSRFICSVRFVPLLPDIAARDEEG